MAQTTGHKRTFESAASIITGLLAVVGGLFLIGQALVSHNKFDRWQAAPLVRETGGFQATSSGSDAVVVGSIDLKNRVTAEGLVVYNQMKQYSAPLRYRRRYWTQVSSGRTAFQLRLSDQTIMVYSERAALLNAQEVLTSLDTKYEGFGPGQRVTVFGTVVSPRAPFEVRANMICGGNGEECLEGFSTASTSFLQMAAIVILSGGGIIWLGARKPRTPPSELAA
jgi:hypothetical protein